ncbi:HNH endonuclease [Flavisolibacter nicotianae]|uniref:HNH endonuclease n=1 Tax=Flavisolibacter nicotianae TaxID=2364882 RepID=UPI000EB51AEB|nr:HNH endonuclease [Flavisolibacter nicotianae]
MNALSRYVQKFSKLRVDRSKGKPAPHKPILLLSIIEGLTKNEIGENKIYITPELVATFKDYWHQLVSDTRFTPNFSLPFYHLKSDGFWHLQTTVGRELLLTSSHSIKSFSQLKQVVDFAYFNEDLFELLTNAHTRQILKQTLLDVYFNSARLDASHQLIGAIIDQILHEPSVVYKTKASTFDEEEVFVRSGVFKKEIPKIYNYTCSISGMRIITDRDIQMIDACHIVPFSESHDDTIKNGISLCPNLHRAFDRGLISLDAEYRVLVKPFTEQENFYSIKQFAGRQILLPTNKNYFPAKENLAAHRLRHSFI